MAFDPNKPLDDERYRAGPPALKADKIDGNAAVITVRAIDEVEVDDPDRVNTGGKRYVLKLDSEEYPEHGYFLNTTGRRIITEKYGAVPGKWKGRQVPLIIVKVFNPKAKQVQDSLQVAPAGEWDEMLAEFNSSTRRAAPKRKIAAAKKKPGK